jgi:hypothetical protein
LNWNIDAGDLLTLGGMLITLYTMHKSNIKRIAGMEFRVGLMWKHFARRFDLPENLEEASDSSSHQ